MSKRIIEISVNDEYVVGSGVVIGAAGSDNSVILRAKFNDTWVGLNIYATFRDAKGENPHATLLIPSMLKSGETMVYDIEVPASATAIDGKTCVVFSGFVVTNNYVLNTETNAYDQLVYRDAVINTANAYFRVLPSDFSALDVKDEAEATALEQLLGEINAFRGEIDDFKDAVGDVVSEHEDKVAATIGDLGTYEDENGELAAYTVEGRLAAQDSEIEEEFSAQRQAYCDFRSDILKKNKEIVETLDGFVSDCDDGKYTVGIASIEKEISAQYTDPSAANYCVDTYKIRLTDGKNYSFAVTNGSPFTVARIYGSVADMNAGHDSDEVPMGAFVVIDTGNVEDEDNAKLYVKGLEAYAFIADLSGAAGIQGPKGDAYVITEEDKADISEEIQEKYFGDIDSALDAILAIQHKLLGIITFTIDGTEYKAKEGMTWDEWVDSKYNTVGAYLEENAVGSFFVQIDGRNITYLATGFSINSAEFIVGEEQYGLN